MMETLETVNPHFEIKKKTIEKRRERTTDNQDLSCLPPTDEGKTRLSSTSIQSMSPAKVPNNKRPAKQQNLSGKSSKLQYFLFRGSFRKFQVEQESGHLPNSTRLQQASSHQTTHSHLTTTVNITAVSSRRMSHSAEVLCLICSSSTIGDNKSSVSRVFEEEDAVWNKLCSYWLLSPRNFKKTLEVCSAHQLCRGCMHAFKDVIKIHSQLVSLEERIKAKAHEMARLINESAKAIDDSSNRKVMSEDVWIKFKDPVIQNYNKYIKPPTTKTSTLSASLPTTAIITYEVSNEEYYQEVEIHVESTPSAQDQETDDEDSLETQTNSARLPSFGTIECPKCPFSVPYDQRSSAGAAYRTRSNAKNGINTHYTAKHNQVKRGDFSCDSFNKDERFYQCTMCSFKSFIRQGASPSDTRRLAARENDAVHILSRHYIDFHEKPTVDNGTIAEYRIGCGLEGEDIFTCPVDDCQFVSTIPECSTKTPNRKVENKRPALCKLGTHYLRTHEFPKSKILGRHPCLEVIAGKESFKCPRCNFRAEVNLSHNVPKPKKNGRGGSKSDLSYRNNRRRVASMSFIRHFVSHVYPI